MMVCVCGLKGSFSQNCIQMNACQFRKGVYCIGQHLNCKTVQAPGCWSCCQSHCVVTSVWRGRGILSLDKHVALITAVTSWNGIWHKVATQAINKLYRYTTEQGKTEGGEIWPEQVIIASPKISQCTGTDRKLFTFLPISTSNSQLHFNCPIVSTGSLTPNLGCTLLFGCGQLICLFYQALLCGNKSF